MGMRGVNPVQLGKLHQKKARPRAMLVVSYKSPSKAMPLEESRAGMAQLVWVRFRAPPMPACRYVEENYWTATLATKRSAGVTPEVNLRKHKYMPLPSVDKAEHSGFETQRRCYQKSKTGVSVAPQK